MTPREVSLSIRAFADRRFMFLDDLTWAAWHAGYYQRVDKLTGDMLEKDMPSRKRRTPRARTVEEEIAVMEAFFGRMRRAQARGN